MDGRALQAIDGASTKMAQTHGRALRGERSKDEGLPFLDHGDERWPDETLDEGVTGWTEAGQAVGDADVGLAGTSGRADNLDEDGARAGRDAAVAGTTEVGLVVDHRPERLFLAVTRAEHHAGRSPPVARMEVFRLPAGHPRPLAFGREEGEAVGRVQRNPDGVGGLPIDGLEHVRALRFREDRRDGRGRRRQ